RVEVGQPERPGGIDPEEPVVQHLGEPPGQLVVVLGDGQAARSSRSASAATGVSPAAGCGRAGSQRLTASAPRNAHAAPTPIPIASVNACAAASTRLVLWAPESVEARALAFPIESSAAVREASGSEATWSWIFDA